MYSDKEDFMQSRLYSRRCFIKNAGSLLVLPMVGELKNISKIPLDKAHTSMYDAHKLSEPFITDPAFAKDVILPDASGLSLFSNKKTPPYWLYHWSDLESYLLKRMRHEAFFTCINVGHPGHFKNFNSVIFLRHHFDLNQIPPNCYITIFFSGIIDLRINEQLIVPHYEALKPIEYRIDIKSVLKEKENKVMVRVHRIDQPPTFLLDSPFLQTDGTWEISYDSQNWQAPACFPYENKTMFPHQETLPTITIRPKKIEKGIYDFGIELLGKPVFKTESEVKFYVGESLPEAQNSKEQDFEQNVPSLDAASSENIVSQNFALRYLRIDAPNYQKVTDAKFIASFYPTRYRGAFACSDNMLNKIWMSSSYTLRLCMQELLVDGIKRDRLPWGGDLFLGNLCNTYSFAEPNVVARTMTALYSQSPQASDINGIADYTLYWIITLRDYVYFYGDVDYLKRVEKWLLQLLQILASKEDSNGLLPSNQFSWIFIDWVRINHEDYSSCIQMLYIMALEAASQIFKLLNNQKQSNQLQQKLQHLQGLCQTFFWNTNHNIFVDNWQNNNQGNHISRYPNIFAILSNTAKENQTKHLVKNILLNQAIEPVGTPFMKALECKALAKCGQIEPMLLNIATYWGGMLKKDATTFWEAYNESDDELEQYSFYNRPFGKSLCHAWSAGPVFLLSSELFGIQCSEIGWKRFIAFPKPMGLEWACVSIPIPNGLIRVWQEKNVFSVSVPEHTCFDNPFDKKTYQGPETVIIEL